MPRINRIATMRRVEALHNQFEQSVKLDLLHGLHTFKQGVSDDAIRAAFMKGDYKDVMGAIDFPALGGKLGSLQRTLLDVGDASAHSAAKQLPMQATLRYDNSNPRMREMVAQRTGDMIKRTQEGMIPTIKDAVLRAKDVRVPPQVVANQIRDSIGLNDRQARALKNYRNTLSQSGMEQERIDKLADTYNEKLLDQRAIMIARTETRNATNWGQQDVWNQAVDNEFIPGDSEQEWLVDGDPCEAICKPMDGVRVALGEDWELPNGDRVSVPSLAHPNCFLGTTRVLTPSGYRRIDSIRPGDLVITHKAHPRTATHVLRNAFEGSLVCLRIGTRLIECTPNHQFLVDGQWVPASQLSEGDKCLDVGRMLGVPLKQVGHKPSLAGEVSKFACILQRLAWGRVPVSAMHLDSQHGFSTSQVDIEFKRRQQRSQANTALREQVNEALLQLRWLMLAISTPGSFDTRKLRVGAFGASDVGSTRHGTSSFFRDESIRDFMRLTGVSQRDATPNQDCFDSLPTYAEGLARISQVTARQVGLDDALISGLYMHTQSSRDNVYVTVTQKTTRSYAGEVFNLTVDEDHSYVAEGVAVHNCMCSALLVLPGER